MIKLADNITIGFVSKGGKLEELLKGIDTNNVLEYSKKMHYNE